MKNYILTVAIIFFATFAFTQSSNDNNPKHTNFYTIPEPIKNNDVTITFTDAVAKMEYAKLKIKITNNTADYIVFKPTECVFTIDGKEYTPEKGMIIIKPYDGASKVLEVKGGNNFHRDLFTLKVAGLYKVPANGDIQPAADFILPVASNSFEAGVFKCTMTNVKKETQETAVKFDVVYNGDNFGIIEPTKPTVKIANKNNPQDIQEFATANIKARPIVLQKGEEGKFTIEFKVPGKFSDMQFAKMSVLWKNTFMDSKPTPLASSTVTFNVDATLTEGKNK